MKLLLAGIGLATSGMPLWREARAVLRGTVSYRGTELADQKPARLPPNERRRTTPLIRLAFQAAEQAAVMCPLPLEDLALVFGSSGGDTRVIHQICSALAEPERIVSPTQFHNSVHNAAAGYWSIATRACGATTCLSAYNDTVGAALLEAGALVCEEGSPVLCVCCDHRPVPPLLAKRPTLAPFAAALVLLPQPDAAGAGDPAAIATLELATTEAEETGMRDRALEALRLGNPAARVLPLLQALASDEGGAVVLPAPGRNLSVRVIPA